MKIQNKVNQRRTVKMLFRLEKNEKPLKIEKQRKTQTMGIAQNKRQHK